MRAAEARQLFLPAANDFARRSPLTDFDHEERIEFSKKCLILIFQRFATPVYPDAVRVITCLPCVQWARPRWVANHNLHTTLEQDHVGWLLNYGP